MSNNLPVYIPRTGSLADRVLDYFRQAPEEELTQADIAHKFDVSRGSISACMETALSKGAVACWNVCDGMSTESLELMPGQFFKPLNQRLLAVEAQREELLKALKSVLQWIDDNCETTGFEEIEAQADAAILTCGEASSSPAAPLTIPTTSVLIGQSLVMAELLKTAVAVIRTIPGDTTEESDALQELIDQSEAAIAAVLTEHAMPKAAGEVPHG